MKTFKTYLEEGKERLERMRSSLARKSSSDPRIPDTADQHARQMELMSAIMAEKAKQSAKQMMKTHQEDPSLKLADGINGAREILKNPAKYVSLA